MIRRSEAVVLSQQVFRESSVLLTVYSKEEGLLKLIAKGVRSSRRRKSGGGFQPGQLLQIVYYYKPSRDLQYLSESTPQSFQLRIFTEPIRILYVLLFLEIFTKIVREEEPNPRLYALLTETIHTYENIGQGFFSVLIRNLLKLTAQAGCCPMVATEEWRSAPLQLQLETGQIITCKFGEAQPAVTHLARFLKSNPSEEQEIKVPKPDREATLTLMLRFLEVQVPGFETPKSYSVFKSVFTNP